MDDLSALFSPFSIQLKFESENAAVQQIFQVCLRTRTWVGAKMHRTGREAGSVRWGIEAGSVRWGIEAGSVRNQKQKCRCDGDIRTENNQQRTEKYIVMSYASILFINTMLLGR